MADVKMNNTVKRIVDAVMTVLLLFLMAYQVTGEMAHEWIGAGMTAVVFLHQILNRKWYGVLFKGKYNPYRTVTSVLNILLLACFALTAFCGLSMSSYAVPFLYGMAPVSFVRRMHLSMSHWAFVLMGLHLGMHIPTMIAGWKLNDRQKQILTCISACIGGIGLYLFLKNGMPNYLFFRVPFAFLDYAKAGWQVFLENLLMLGFWALIGTETARICMSTVQTAKTKKNILFPAVAMAVSVILGGGLALVFPPEDGLSSFGNDGWSQPQESASVPAESAAPQQASKPDNNAAIEDGFVRIEGGSFRMGSPDTENWRIGDETLHEGRVASFFMDSHETTQGEYTRLMKENPSVFDSSRAHAPSITRSV
ncbi:MAG: SUMF1/EgtB/PvdO family nonheme iron enzyme [Solobacterium sp.]|nr:SUMF1/EgtB/PvdO family nonheme iron enzyme [Solobacterium sp.]